MDSSFDYEAYVDYCHFNYMIPCFTEKDWEDIFDGYTMEIWWAHKGE